ncbi:MAG: 16S rRNA (uracil(1498)-N(3))-methyltransferase [Acidothermaceae bacterium]
MTTAPLFFADPDRLRAAAVGDLFVLDGAEGRHAATVRRLTVGEKLELSDAEGLLCAAEVAAVSAHAISVRIMALTAVPAPSPRLTVVQALAKGERDERAVETMTEVGVDTIVPWRAGRSIVRWDPARAAKGVARWRSTAHEASKQARRPRVPVVADTETTAAVVERVRQLFSSSGLGPSSVALVLHESASRPLAEVAVADADEIVLIVGPEGGISADELAAFEAVGAQAVRLGPTVLRTSTAGTVAAAVVLANSGRWTAATER